MRCVTVTIYDKTRNPDQDIFVVEGLSDRLFSLGFRVVNPEFNASPDRIKQDSEAVGEFCDLLDTIDKDEYHAYHRVSKFTRSALDINRRGI